MQNVAYMRVCGGGGGGAPHMRFCPSITVPLAAGQNNETNYEL